MPEPADCARTAVVVVVGVVVVVVVVAVDVADGFVVDKTGSKV